MVVTGCAFHPNTNTLVTVSTDYSYRFTSMSEFHFVKWATQMGMQLGVLLIVLIFIADYLYN